MKDIGVIYLVEDPIDQFPGETPRGFIGTTPRRFREVFTLSERPRSFTGIHKLAQMVSKILLTRAGSDSYSPSMGGGIREMAGNPVGESDVRSAQRDLSIMLSVIEDQIARSQRNLDLEPDERLLQLDLISADFDFAQTRWKIRIRLTASSGDSVAINIPSVELEPS
jgi:hypothetical protein